MTVFRADLHTHTSCSDGSLTPIQLIELACELGLNGLAITDHDTIEAFAAALPAAKDRGLPLISGVELSAVHQGVSIHVLGYGFDLKSTSLQGLCQKHLKRREARNSQILELLAKHQMPLTMDEVEAQSSEGTIGRPHIAEAMRAKGYVTSLMQAFEKFIGEGKSCFARGEFFSVEETIEVIHAARGFAVIAHPHLIKNNKIVQNLLKLNFDGIECYYGNFEERQNKAWANLATQHQMLITAGSDFHGKMKPHALLGSSYAGEEIFNRLYAHFESVNQ